MVKKEGEVAEVEAKAIEEKVAVIEEKIAEAKAETPAQDLASQLEGLKRELEDARNEAKAHQRNVSKKEEELQAAKAQTTRNAGIDSRLEILTTMVADMMDKEPFEEEGQPKKRRSEEYLAKLEEVTKQSKQQADEISKQKHQQIVDEVLRQLNSAGLDAKAMETLEFATAENLFLKGKPEEGLEEVKKIVMTKTEAKKETKESPEEIKKRIREEVRKEILIERGELEAETGQPSVVNTRIEQIRKSYRENPNDPKAYREYREALGKGLFKI